MDVATCTICVEEIASDDIVTLPCGHPFHGRCLAPWLWQNQSCPNCREHPENPDTTGPGVTIPLHELWRTLRESERRSRNDFVRAVRLARAANAPLSCKRAYDMRVKWRMVAAAEARQMHAAQKRVSDESRWLRKEYARMREEWQAESTRIAREFRARVRPIKQELTRHRGKRSRAEQRVARYQRRLIELTSRFSER